MRKFMVLLMLSLIAPVHSAFVLTRNGNPAAEIIITANSQPAVKYAAEELKHWVKEISGAELPIVNQPGKAVNHIILAVNPENFTEDLSKLKDNDGYAIRQQGNAVYIIASCPKGVLNGVYKWLYKNTDIIWARPNPEFGTVFSNNPDLVFKDNNYIDIPAFVLRGWQMIGPNNHIPSNKWQYRNGSNWSVPTDYAKEREKYGQIFEYGGGHNLNGIYITEKKYYAEHPEFFPLKNGKRIRPSAFKHKAQLCFSNPEMIQAFIAELDARVKANPNYEIYRIMIEDNWLICECPECLEPIEIAGKTIDHKDKSFRSTQFFQFLNQVARHMRQHYPGKRILTFAYFFTEFPPYCQIEPNISISFCPIHKDSKFNLESPKNTATMAKFQGWLKVTNQLTWREYYGLVPPFPRPTDVIALADWKYISQFGINRTYSEMYTDAASNRMDGVKSWDANAMYFWVMANGSWNPTQNVMELRQEFLKRVFGDGAADVSEYYRLIEEQWFKSPGKSIWNDSGMGNWRKCVYRTGIEIPCRQALERAAGKVKNSNGQKMLAAIRNNFEENIQMIKNLQITAVKISGAPQFDPDFASGEWLKAIPADQFYINASLNPHTEKTALRVLYDDKNIYFGVKCFHKDVSKMYYRPPTPDKNIFPDGEGFEIFLAGVWKNRKHFTQMVFDPNNNRYSAVKPIKWTSQVQVTDDGWSGMITVPWREIGLNPDNTKSLNGLFVRQFMRSPQPGTAPARAAVLFGGNRHNQDAFHTINLK